ncbi:hypothetical protein Ancab_032287 [Ancistrocladus abbreviatus]
MDDLLLQKVTIPGPTLASLMHRFSSFTSDTDGLLFGRVSHVIPSSLSDDSDSTSATSTSSSSSTLVATITGFISSGITSSFYDSSGQLDITSLRHLVHPSSNHSLIGWFSARRLSALRPSLREFAVSQSLISKPQFSFPIENNSLKISPCIFLLLTTPFPDHQSLIHTFDYRVFQFRTTSKTFDAKPLDVINIGPAFRGHYSAFCPNSHLPYLMCDPRDSPMKEDGNLRHMKKLSDEQKELDMYVEGYALENLRKLMGSQATSYTSGLEELYEKMLGKLNSLARLVESSSARVLEQEKHNTKLRYKVAGLE